MIQNKHKLAFLLCLLLMATTAFGASEAEYKKLAKTWTLNADGSQEFRYNMELTLFTHTAMKIGLVGHILEISMAGNIFLRFFVRYNTCVRIAK